ncbi:MAG: ArsA-related P-loop ATPase, partial [Actinomycetota bacterium]|nr:ArsA-related P-loop ATPase [Actinomycetota bacterium]
MITDLISERSVIVCCGSGGVGKTTMAASIGLAAATLGRKVVVITVDPARRLGDALGLENGLGADPTRVVLPDGVPGEL